MTTPTSTSQAESERRPFLPQPAVSRPDRMPGLDGVSGGLMPPFAPSMVRWGQAEADAVDTGSNLSGGAALEAPAVPADLPLVPEPEVFDVDRASTRDRGWLETLDREPEPEPGPAAIAVPDADAGPDAGPEAEDLPPWMAWIDDATEAVEAQPAAEGPEEFAAEANRETGADEPAGTATATGWGETPPDLDDLPVLAIEALAYEAAAQDAEEPPQFDLETLAPQLDDAAASAEVEPQAAEPEEQIEPEEPQPHAEPEPVSAEAALAGLAAPGVALPDAFSGVYSEVAERLDSIADSLRRRSRGEPLPGSREDPLELLLTGFVLGYMARQGREPRRPDSD